MRTWQPSEATVLDEEQPAGPGVLSGDAAEIDVGEVLEAFRDGSRTGAPARTLFDPLVRCLRGPVAPVVTAPCPVCDGEAGEPQFEIDGFKHRLVRCLDCGTGRLWPLPSTAEIARFYPSEYYGAAGAKFRPIIERAVRTIAAARARRLARGLPAAARVLDVGCGRGVLLGALADRGCEVHGFEISPTAVLGADSRTHLRIAECLAAACYPAEFFDEVILCHVLEHLPDPRETLLEVRRILKPRGRLVVAVPNLSSLQARWMGPAWFHLDLPRHLYHFPQTALQRLLARCGFESHSARHFALDQNVFGWLQSLLNRAAPSSRNGLYAILRNGSANTPSLLRVARACRLLLGAACTAPLAVLLSLVEPVLRRGGTITIQAHKAHMIPGSTEIQSRDSERRRCPHPGCG
jgi:2-polyprenyl-3-methyl-5-hydroxy-6-metoxy-1,4-benzoquinol methylase